MTHTVKTSFPTAHRRFHAGQTITELDCDSPEQFNRMVELGVIVKASVTPSFAKPVGDPPPEAT
jgi:hypothetical protein